MFKILMTASNDLTTQNIRIGYANALKHLGHEVVWYDPSESAHDSFYRERPDIFLTSSLEISHSAIKACAKYKPKVIFFIATDNETSNGEYGLAEALVATDVDIYPFAFYKEQKSNPWQIWLNNGFLPWMTKPGADTVRFSYMRCKFRPELACDISYVGDWRPEKTTLLKLLEEEYEQGKSVRIYGRGHWNHPLHVGLVNSDQQYMDIIIASKLNIYYERNEFLNIHLCLGETGRYDNTGKLFITDSVLTNSDFINKESYINRVTEMLKCLES